MATDEVDIEYGEWMAVIDGIIDNPDHKQLTIVQEKLKKLIKNHNIKLEELYNKSLKAYEDSMVNDNYDLKSIEEDDLL